MRGREAAGRRTGQRTLQSRRPRLKPSGRVERCRRMPDRRRSGSIRETVEQGIPEQPVCSAPILSRLSCPALSPRASSREREILL
jgi:hypothetical protein